MTTFPLDALHSVRRLRYNLSLSSVHSPLFGAGLGLKIAAMTSVVAVLVMLCHLFRSEP